MDTVATVGRRVILWSRFSPERVTVNLSVPSTSSSLMIGMRAQTLFVQLENLMLSDTAVKSSGESAVESLE